MTGPTAIGRWSYHPYQYHAVCYEREVRAARCSSRRKRCALPNMSRVPRSRINAAVLATLTPPSAVITISLYNVSPCRCVSAPQRAQAAARPSVQLVQPARLSVRCAHFARICACLCVLTCIYMAGPRNGGAPAIGAGSSRLAAHLGGQHAGRSQTSYPVRSSVSRPGCFPSPFA